MTEILITLNIAVVIAISLLLYSRNKIKTGKIIGKGLDHSGNYFFTVAIDKKANIIEVTCEEYQTLNINDQYTFIK